MQLTLQRPAYLLSTLDKVNYYEKIADEFNTNLMHGAGAAGFEPSIYNKYVKADEAKKVSNAYINEFFNKGASKIPNDDFRTRLIAHLKTSAALQNIEVDENDTAFLNYVNRISNSYSKFFEFPFLQYADMAIKLLNNVMPLILIACIVFLVLAIVFIKRLKLEKELFVQYIVSSFVGGGLMSVIIPIIVYMGKYIDRVSLSPQCFYDFFNSYIYGYLNLVLLFGFGLILIGVLLYVLSLKKKTIEIE